MSNYSINTLIAELEGILHGTTVNQIQNLNGVINRSARKLLLDLDPQETKREVEFINPIFNTVYDYPVAADLKGNKIIDIYPQVRRMASDVWSQQYNQAFDTAKQNLSQNSFNVHFDTGIKTLRVNAPWLNTPVILDQIDYISTNGTWSVGGTASNLIEDNSNYVQGNGSLKFDITTDAGYIENSTLSGVNLSDVVNQAYLFSNVYIPIGTNLTSINLRFGSSASNYYTLTVTQNQQSLAFNNGWNLGQFIWSNMSTVGTPDTTDITYARITLNVTANMNGCRVNGLNSILGTILSYSYYSKYLFRDVNTGAFQETVTDNSNLINLDTETYNLLVFLVAYYSAQQQQGQNASYDGSYFLNEYTVALQKYKQMYKSEVQKPQTSYYPHEEVGYGRYLGRRYK